VHYQYDDCFDDGRSGEGLERCAACGDIFDAEDAEPEDDE
jgi:hypothetical protein